MTKPACMICDFLHSKSPYKPMFEKKAREGASIPILQAYLEGLGLRVRSPKTIRKHFAHMPREVMEQRACEKSLKSKAKRKLRKIPEFFIPKKGMLVTDECSHEQTVSFYDIPSEKVFTKCKSCGAILGRGLDPKEYDRKMELKWKKLGRVLHE